LTASTDDVIGRLTGDPELTTTIGELNDWYSLPPRVRGLILFACGATQLWILISLTGYKSKHAKARMRDAINAGHFLDYIENPDRRIELRA
jgi:hypothetical protein